MYLFSNSVERCNRLVRKRRTVHKYSRITFLNATYIECTLFSPVVSNFLMRTIKSINSCTDLSQVQLNLWVVTTLLLVWSFACLGNSPHTSRLSPTLALFLLVLWMLFCIFTFYYRESPFCVSNPGYIWKGQCLAGASDVHIEYSFQVYVSSQFWQQGEEGCIKFSPFPHFLCFWFFWL